MAGSELYGGRLQDGGLDAHTSLAGYLEQAIDEVREETGLDPLPEEGRRDRLVFLLGLARGVVAFLADHGEAFRIDPGHDEDHTHEASAGDGGHTHGTAGSWDSSGGHDHPVDVEPSHGDAHRHGGHVRISAEVP